MAHNFDSYLLNGMEGEAGLERAISHVATGRRFHGWKKDSAKFEAQFKPVVRALPADAAAREKVPSPKLWKWERE